jgi:hypothetical protein
MAVVPRPFPKALPHGEIEEVLPGVFMVSGTAAKPAVLPVRFSRNMVIVRGPQGVVLVNSVRLSATGLAALDALGKVTDVLRIAGNHGMDDPFYKDRYGAKVWGVRGQRYTAGFGSTSADVYFEPDVEMDEHTALPIAGARLYTIASTPPEALLLLEQNGGTCIAGDCLQHWHQPDRYFSWFGKLMMKRMGFIKPYNVGPAWLSRCKPPKQDLQGIVPLAFSNVLPAHGAPVLGDAVAKYRASLDAATR